MGRACDGPNPRSQVGDPHGRGSRAGGLRGALRAGARHRARACGAGWRSRRLGQGHCPRGRASSVRTRLRRAWRSPDPCRDSGHQPGRAEGRQASRLQARGHDAPRDQAWRRGRRQRGMGPPARGVHRLGGQAELTADGPLAEVIADRGEAAQTADFFRSRAFYDAEGVTHTLRIENGEAAIALPLLVREIPGTERSDAISPYGYPGAAVRGDAGSPPEPARVDWSRTGLVSVFARERLGHEPCLAGATLRSVVQVHDPARPRSLRSRFGEQIRRSRKLGYRVEVLEGPRTSVEERASFHGAYTETMHRS